MRNITALTHLIEDMTMSGMHEFVCRILALHLGNDIPPRTDWAELATLMEAPAYLTDLNGALALIPSLWWWHLSHLGAFVTPTVSELDSPMETLLITRPRDVLWPTTCSLAIANTLSLRLRWLLLG
jgi:hypothetical protein